MTVYIFIGASGLFGDVWASWIELVVNVTVTLLLAPHYGIAGILLGKITSVFFITTVWKPYYLFTRTFKKNFSEYVLGIVRYYGVFAVCAALAIFTKYHVIDTHVDSLPSLIAYGLATAVPLLTIYFLLMFIVTNGMKYFVARKPAIYQVVKRLTFTK
jgi:hypothetical protein